MGNYSTLNIMCNVGYAVSAELRRLHAGMAGRSGSGTIIEIHFGKTAAVIVASAEKQNRVAAGHGCGIVRPGWRTDKLLGWCTQ